MLYPSLLLFCATLGGCSGSSNLAVFVILRALMGLAGISFMMMGSAVIADMIHNERRGLALSIIMCGPSIVSWLSSCQRLKTDFQRDQL